MKRIALAALLALAAALCSPKAEAQWLVVPSCPGTQTLTVGTQYVGTIDVHGTLCTAASVSSASVTIADGADVTQGALADSACGTDNGSCTVAALLKRNNQRLTTITAGIPVTNAGTFPTQSAITAAGGSMTDLGAIADAAATAGSTGTLSAKLRTLTALGANPFTYSAKNLTSTFTLPSQTTAYTAGFLICTSATVATCNTGLASAFFTIDNSAGAVAISRIRLATNDATSTAWGAQTIQIDLWSAAPTFATTGDRASFTTDFLTGAAGHLATFNCTMSAELADGAYAECAPSVGSYALIKLASGTSVFYTLNAITGSGVTGASKVFTLTAEVVN